MLAKGLPPSVSYDVWRADGDSLFYPVIKDIEEGHRWFLFYDRAMEGAYGLTRSGTVDLKILLAHLGIDPDEFAVEPYFPMYAPRMRFPLNAPLGTAAQCQDDIFDTMLSSIMRFPWDGGVWNVLSERPFSIRVTLDKMHVGDAVVPIYRWFEFGGNLLESDGLVFSYVNDDTFAPVASPYRSFHGGDANLYHCRVAPGGRVHGLVELMENRLDKLFAGAISWTCSCCGVEHSFRE